MRSRIQAEWTKNTGNRWLTAFLVWGYPTTALVIALLGALVAWLNPGQAGALGLEGAHWTDALGTWGLLSRFPANALGRMPLLAYAAVAFAGEYQWGTWKNIAPFARRWELLLAKFVALAGLALAALALTAVVWGPLRWALASALNAAGDAPANADAFARDLGLEIVLAVLAFAVVSAYAALGALFTRSVLGSLLAGVGLGVAEMVSFLVLMLAGRIIDRPDLVDLYQYTPAYCIDNIRAWVTTGGANAFAPPGFTATPSPEGSALVLALWVIGLAVLVALVFERQDLTG